VRTPDIDLSVGRYALKGVGRARELFTLHPGL
jgi:hypothetical protein